MAMKPAMNEHFLQFIWQNQYFNKNELRLTSGTPFRILYQGNLNSDQGPDFTDARINIENHVWAGNIELHILSSDWKRHEHQTDANYNNVILHVVWVDDELNATNDIPVFVLAGRIPKFLLFKYEGWMNTDYDFIPCSPQISNVSSLLISKWQDHLIQLRLNRRYERIKERLTSNHFHWEEIFWEMLAKNFGIRVNAEAFEELAKSISLNLLIKHKNQIHALEAMLLGQAGLLENPLSEQYPLLLQKEYSFYKRKYGLKPIHQPVHFLRMRPVNFPTVRLAQLAMFLHTTPGFFSFIRDCENPRDLRAILTVTANDYWHYHYRFDEIASYRPKQTGPDIINNIFINTVVPMLYAYGKINHLDAYTNKALSWLLLTAPERNPVISSFTKSGIQTHHAGHTQALLEMKNHFCEKKKCLECAIGKFLLKEMN